MSNNLKINVEFSNISDPFVDRLRQHPEAVMGYDDVLSAVGSAAQDFASNINKSGSLQRDFVVKGRFNGRVTVREDQPQIPAI